jgi:hypothetical protein
MKSKNLDSQMIPEGFVTKITHLLIKKEKNYREIILRIQDDSNILLEVTNILNN